MHTSQIAMPQFLLFLELKSNKSLNYQAQKCNTATDVTAFESKSECCGILTFFAYAKCKIWRIFRLIYVGSSSTFTFESLILSLSWL